MCVRAKLCLCGPVMNQRLVTLRSHYDSDYWFWWTNTKPNQLNFCPLPVFPHNTVTSVSRCRYSAGQTRTVSKHHVSRAIFTKLIKKRVFQGAAAPFKGCSRDERDCAPISPQLVALVSSGGSSRINSARLWEAEPSDRLECSYKRLTSGFSKQAQQG